MNQLAMSIRLHLFKEKSFFRNSLVSSQPKSKSSLYLIFGLILVVCLFYLWQTNSLATKGYQINSLQSKVSDLRKTNKQLQLQITELRSTERITKEVEALKMVQVARVEYLKADGSTVALNR